MLTEELSARSIPDVLTFFDGKKVGTLSAWEERKSEIKDCLQNEIYGKIPKPPKSVKSKELENDSNFCAGKADLRKTELICELENGNFSFPVYCTVPKKKPEITFLLINFRDNVPDRYLPAEELVDNNCAVFSFCYEDVTSDNDDFKNGLAGVLSDGGKRKSNDSGKIAMWAWAAMRVMDYIETLNYIDNKKVVVIGHSRLGKTALLAAAFDERFMSAASNDSGCCGAALIRGKTGEGLSDIYNKFGQWFCPEFKKHALENKELSIDQHCLLALIAPRKLYVASAESDFWADPKSEFLSCVAASEVYGLYSIAGLVHTDNYVVPPEYLHSGNIAYHCRTGTHYFSREDWLLYLKYFLDIKR